MSPAAMAQATASDGTRFEEWCDCVRQLLGWSGGERDDWRALFSSGRTPREAARMTVYGDSDGD